MFRTLTLRLLLWQRAHARNVKGFTFHGFFIPTSTFSWYNPMFYSLRRRGSTLVPIVSFLKCYTTGVLDFYCQHVITVAYSVVKESEKQTFALAGIILVEKGTFSFSALIIPTTSWSSVNSSRAIPSKHFFKCGCTRKGSLVSDRISSNSSLDKKKNLEKMDKFNIQVLNTVQAVNFRNLNLA